jgi:hypothetical protein
MNHGLYLLIVDHHQPRFFGKEHLPLICFAIPPGLTCVAPDSAVPFQAYFFS